MSYWIKLETGFFTHRKTIRLKGILGDDALWIVPRLWCLAAEQQPDGDFSAYSPDEIAMLVGYSKHAPSMLQALIQAGFLDEGQKLHGWIERNAFHVTNKERATKAALARWGKLPPSDRRDKRRGEESIEHCSSIAPSMARRYPSDVEEAKRMQPVSSVIPEDFVVQCYDKAESRSGHDAKNIPIGDFNAYVRTEWKYEQDRIRTQKHQGHPTGSNRNAGTYNEHGLSTRHTTAELAKISQEKAAKLAREHLAELERRSADANAGGGNGVPSGG